MRCCAHVSGFFGGVVEELVRKLVFASSQVRDMVLDPVSGSGTTAVVAVQLG